MIKKIATDIALFIKSIKKTPIIWLIPFFFMTIVSVINSNPITLLNSLIINSTNGMMVVLTLLKVVAVAVIFTIIFAMILIIIKKVFCEFHESFPLAVKKLSLSMLALMVVVLLPLNIIVEIFQSLVRSSGLMGYYLKYLLILIKCMFFYYIVYIWVDDEEKNKKSFIGSLKASLSWKIISKSLIIIVLIDVVIAPIFYYPIRNLFQSEQHHNSLNLFSLISGYSTPIWLDFLNLFCVAMVHTFLILYVAVLYYGQKREIEC